MSAMRYLAAVILAVLAAGCGATLNAGLSSVRAADTVTGVAASCAGLAPAEQFTAARRVFDGTMLRGAIVGSGSRAVLNSPARVRVTRYLKGSGPRVVKVQTAVRRVRNGVVVASEGIEPRAGQRWRIFTDSPHQPYDTSVCGGSRPLRTDARAGRSGAVG
jgi:hypothetical protein